MCKLQAWQAMGAGIIVGLAIGMVAAPQKKCRTRVGRLLNHIGSVVDHLGSAMGL